MSTPLRVIQDAYGYARAPETIDRIKYGRFRNVYLYITELCQLRCGHCYMGDRLEHGAHMPYDEVLRTLTTWRKMGGSKLSILGGEPTLHPQFREIVDAANTIGYEQVILNTNGLKNAARALRAMEPHQFAYIQVSLDGASPATHDVVRGKNTFKTAWETCAHLAERGFDTRIICTVNKVNIGECMNLLEMADSVGVSLVKFHVFSGIGNGNENEAWLVPPKEWIAFCKRLLEEKGKHQTKIWYQPTYTDKETFGRYEAEGYRGCIGRTLDRISIFPDGRAYVCSYLFDTELNYIQIEDGAIHLNQGPNEFDLFTSALTSPSCSNCISENSCNGGCPAERIVMGASSCGSDPDIVPVCRLWKSEV